MFTNIVMIDYRKPLHKRLKDRKLCGPYRWTPSTPMTGRGFYMASEASAYKALTKRLKSHDLAMDEEGSTIRLRLELANDHLQGRMRFTNGYYCDYDGEGDTLIPIIARLPNNRGFLPGWTMGPGMCGFIDSSAYEDAESAARAAHIIAEHDAEESRRANQETMEAVY